MDLSRECASDSAIGHDAVLRRIADSTSAASVQQAADLSSVCTASLEPVPISPTSPLRSTTPSSCSRLICLGLMRHERRAPAR